MAHRINNQIRAKEVRLLGAEGDNLGVLPIEEALKKAEEAEMDLIEISPNAKPPIVRIMDYGKFMYLEKKKAKETKQKATTVEVKSVQIKVGTGDHDLSLKAKKVAEWISDGDRVKVELFLPGRTKYMDQKFLKERMERFFKLIPSEFNVAEEPKKSPKGLTALIEKVK